MPVDDALARIRARVPAVAGVHEVPLIEADGCVLARDVAAGLPLPPFANSAVDGYAVRFADLGPEGATLRVSGRVPAGMAPQASGGGVAVRIFTGAPMPEGFDTVFMQEDVNLEDGRVHLPPGLSRGANARPAGEDIPAGALALAAGRLLMPQDIALLAALGEARVTVRRPLRVAIFSTGDELVAPGGPLAPAKLYDSNRFLLGALLRRLGCAVTDLGILADERDAVAAALTEGAGAHDLLITSGGVSTGDEDHVKAAVERAGALDFWRIAIKPGRPVALGTVGDAAFIGLPGNPVAVFVTFTQVARALIAALRGEGWRPAPALPVRSGFAYKKKEGRREFVRVSLAPSGDALPVAAKHPREGAGVLTSLTQTDGLVELPEATTRVAPGDVLAYRPFAALF
jgi:molybdopterin molybdotransferase